nr:DMT family transporter [uncultured Desulfobacter sp.]
MTYLKLLLTAFFWGGTFIAGKGLAGHVHPFCAAFLRFTIASFFLVILVIKKEGRLPKIYGRDALLIFLSGLTGIFAYNLFFFSGLTLINANRAALIIATNPIFITFCSAAIFKERLTPLKILGLFLSVCGAMIIITGGDIGQIFKNGIGRGEMAIFGCVASWVCYSLLGRPLTYRFSPLVSVCYSSLAGTLMLFFPAVSKGLFAALPGYGGVEWGSLFYLGYFGTVLGFAWYYQGIKTIGPAKSSVFINFVPISALILSYFILNESVTKPILAGAALVVTGVYMTNLAGFRRKEKRIIDET